MNGGDTHRGMRSILVAGALVGSLALALLLVLRGTGVHELEKLEQLKQSIQFAFHIVGEGKAMASGPAELEEFTQDTLPEAFERVTGRSIDIVQTDDTITIRTNLAAFFPHGESLPIKPRVQLWFNKLVKYSINFTSDVRIRIESPDVVIGRDPNNRAIRSSHLCLARLEYLRHVMTLMPKIWGDSIDLEFKIRPWRSASLRRDWEEDAELIFAFSDKK